MLVLAVLVFASGFALRVAWESLDEPAEAQTVAEGDLYDCKLADFAYQEQAQKQLLPGDPYDLDRDSNGGACETCRTVRSAAATHQIPGAADQSQATRLGACWNQAARRAAPSR